MQKVTPYPDGSRLIHTFEELTPEKRPQEIEAGSLTFTPLEHHGFDLFPEALEITDREGRSCIFVPEQEEEVFSDSRPRDQTMNGKGLRFETLSHGVEYTDRMPQQVRVTDAQARSSVYAPVKVDGKVVESKGFELVPGSGDKIVRLTTAA
ncbi:MAG: hypothetical protein QOD74_2994 [Variibacter sp.]|jgi:hypothetical protein|nr:hypothetical protein [Variibacter sp.]